MFDKLGSISAGQDGAIWGDILLRFGTIGDGRAYRLTDGVPSEISTFMLDKTDLIAPHSNAVMFGCEYYAEGDEFPLLYSNIYNNYAKAKDNLAGVCCVYRLWRQGNQFCSKLVQLIRIGFVQDPDLWCSADGDVRPYGNFTIDREQKLLYAFTMRDGAQVIRYFSFRLPDCREGQWEETFGVPVITLTAQSVLRSFDCPYQRFLQGACCHNGKIYSLEGFGSGTPNPPAMQIVDTIEGKLEKVLQFEEYGLENEPEFIDFALDKCYYSDGKGNMYRVNL